MAAKFPVIILATAGSRSLFVSCGKQSLSTFVLKFNKQTFGKTTPSALGGNMTDEQLEFDRLVRSCITRPTQGCKCLEAMLQGYRQRYNRDDESLCGKEPQEKEHKTE